MKRFGLIVLLLTVSATAQVIQLTGGDSSLLHAEGASAKLLFATSETAVSGGVIDGHVYTGVIEKFKVAGWNVAAGDVTLPFNLVTDFYPAQYQFPAVGALASKTVGSSKVTVFAGATATQYQVPFFFGNQAETPTAGIFYERPLTERWTFMSSNTLSLDKQTSIQSLRFKPTDATSLATSAGVGSNSPFFSLRAGYETHRLTGVIAWTKRGDAFQRIVVPYATVVENDGLEAHGAYLSQHFNLSADRQNIVSDIKGTIIRSTVNDVSTNVYAGWFQASATGFYGRSNGMLTKGETGGVGATVSILTGRFDVYNSAGRMSQSVTVTEKLTRHLSVNQFITGLHSVNAGAEYHSNSFTMGGGYSMSFFPALGIFQKVLSVSLSIQLPHNLRIDGGTVTTPDGKTRWTAYGNTYQHGPLTDVIDTGNHSTGKYVYQGKCVTQSGEPVACAVKVGKAEVFAGDNGIFRLPTNKRKSVSLTVMPDEFMAPGKWVVINAPTEVTPDSSITVVVNRL